MARHACAQVVWNGDPSTTWGFDGLTSAVWGGLGIGLSGVALWGSDIGGLGRPFTPCAVAWRDRPLPVDAWSFDATTGALGARFTGRRGQLVVRAVFSGAR